MMLWKLHHLTLQGTTNSELLGARWQRAFASLPPSTAAADITCQLDLFDTIPPPPRREPDWRLEGAVTYYVMGHEIVIQLPHVGQLSVDLEKGETHGRIVPGLLSEIGLLEETITLALSPHLPRQGLFPIRGFAAEWGEVALLLIGAEGVGKTTAGMALLDAGGHLLATELLLVDKNGNVLAYPGLVMAASESFAQFASTRHLIERAPMSSAGRKRLAIAAESVWPDAWAKQAPAGLILFLQLGEGEHRAEALSPDEALRQLLLYALTGGERGLLAYHLESLRRLTEFAPAYILRLGANFSALPDFLTTLMD